jgi:epoxide hydrolase-like protein
MPGLSTVQPAGGGPIDKSRVRPVRVSFPETALHDLSQRVLATRWPDRETVADDTQGLQLATTQALAYSWATDYGWRRCEARLHAEPNFMTVIDGLDFHFIQARSRHDGALSLIVTHGRPGWIIEQLQIIEPLTNLTAHGGTAADSFDVVIPSLPGYGFSANAIGRGCGRRRGGLRVFRQLHAH